MWGPRKQACARCCGGAFAGVVSRVGLQLPLPRRSLGVEFWHKGQTNQYFVLIPRTASVPCRARQVFTTVHDNQEQACILVSDWDRGSWALG